MGVAAAGQGIESRTADSSARVKFIALWALLLAAKLAFAASMPLFGDEAFYAWEALHPAWAYSDLPGGTAAAVGLGSALVEALPLPREFGVRLLFLLAGAAIPWLVVRIARRFGTAGQAWRAGLWSLPIPLLMPMGVMALPDALMTLAAMLALDACAGLLHDDEARRGRLYGQFAFALALGALTHYRFGPLLLVGALAFFAAGGWRRRGDAGLWLALGVGAAAWWPILQFNLDAQGAGLHFQLVERHPWHFNAKGLLQPLLQAVITTPLLYGLFGWALWVHRRAPRPALRFVALAGGGLWLLYAVLAPFVDKARFSLHWPVPAYLLAATLLPIALDVAKDRWARRLAPWAAAMAAAAAALMLAAFILPSSSRLAARTSGTALYPDNFVGWREIADALRPRLADGDVLVADHFMLAAQLSFSLGGGARCSCSTTGTTTSTAAHRRSACGATTRPRCRGSRRARGPGSPSRSPRPRNATMRPGSHARAAGSRRSSTSLRSKARGRQAFLALPRGPSNRHRRGRRRLVRCPSPAR